MRGQRDKHAAEEAKAAVEVIEPCFDDPFPDYDAEPVMMYASG